jgi:hypothetical protein
MLGRKSGTGTPWGLLTQAIPGTIGQNRDLTLATSRAFDALEI